MVRTVVILPSVLSGSGFACFVGTLLTSLVRFSWVYRLLESVAEGYPGHGPAHMHVESAADIGFHWDSRQLGCERLGLPPYSAFLGCDSGDLPGGIRYRLTFVLGRVFEEALGWILVLKLWPCSGER